MIRKVKKNPKNDYLLSDLEIRKSMSYDLVNDPHILYSVYYRYDNKNNLIGKIYVKLGSNSAHVEVHKDFRRQGVASYVYDYIEQDLNIKLKPNLNQLDDGKAFWENRLKQKNPTDLNFLKQIIIDKETFKITDGKDKITSYQYNVYFEGKRIGYAEIVKGQNTVDDIDVLKPYQRKGVSTFLYDYIEKDLNIKLKPSEYLKPDGKKFWENRLKLSKR